MGLEAKPTKIKRRVKHVRLRADDVENLIELMRFDDSSDSTLRVEADDHIAKTFADLQMFPARTGRSSVTELDIYSGQNRLYVFVTAHTAQIVSGFQAPNAETYQAERAIYGYLRNRRDRWWLVRRSAPMLAVQWAVLLIAEAILLIPDPRPNSSVTLGVLIAVTVITLGTFVWAARREEPDAVWLSDPPRFTDRHINVASLAVGVLSLILTVVLAVFFT